MFIKPSAKNREKRKRFAHIGAGIVILIHAYEKWETGHGPYLLFAIAGLVFLSVAAFHPVIEKRLPWIDGLFFTIEGILSAVVAYEFFHAGKKALPFCYLLLSVFQFIMAYVFSRRGIRHHRQLHH